MKDFFIEGGHYDKASDYEKELYGPQLKLRDLSELQQKTLLNDFATVFGTEEGKRVLGHIMAMCLINASPFTGNSATFYREGMQEIGRTIRRIIMETDPDIVFDVERRALEAQKDERS